MNAFRAKRIADQLAHIRTFRVKNKLYGLFVIYRGDQVYFESEEPFWECISNIAQASHEEDMIAEVEARLN